MAFMAKLRWSASAAPRGLKVRPAIAACGTGQKYLRLGESARPRSVQRGAPLTVADAISKIWLGRFRDLEELGVVLRADFLGHRALDAVVALRHGPRRVEGIRILERDVHLHRLAAVNQPEPFDDVQLLGMR